MVPSPIHRRAHLLSQDANPLCFVSVVFGGEQRDFFVSALTRTDFSHVVLPNCEP